jgi:hypothetical protein
MNVKRLCGVVGCALLITIGTLPAAAQDDTPGENLGGYDVQSSAAAFSFQPFLPALVSTGDVPFEASIQLTTARVKSGGDARSRAAVVWPGSAAANFGPILGVAFGQPEAGSLIPAWPLQAEATQADGEVTTGAPPGLEMRAIGRPDRSVGDSRIVDIDIPRLVHIEHMASTSESAATDDAVSSVARATLHGVSLLAGHITIEEIRSISRTTSTGDSATTSGDVDVVGMKVGGVDVSVTDDGFQIAGLPKGASQLPGAGGKPFPGQSPEAQVNQVLRNLGVRITLFNGVGKASSGQANHLELGLVLSVDNPVGGQGPIPPGRFDFILASTSSSSFASPPFTVAAPSLGEVAGGELVSEAAPAGSLGAGPEVAGSSLTSVGERLTGAAAAAPGTASVPSDVLEAVPQRGDYEFDGVPMGMTIGLLLLALVIARYVRNFFRSIMAASAGAGSSGTEE